MSGWLGGFSGAAARSKTPPIPDGKPLPLVGFDEASGQWRAGDEALAVVARCRSPIAVLAVCGRARQGKSFVLNQMLQRLTGQPSKSGFVVSPTHQSCTRGLWLWSVPIPVEGAGGKKASLLLVDCEGVDAYDQGAQAAAQVFSLAVLLSSVFVFNQLGAVDAVAIERLALACELAKRVKDRSGGDGGGGGGGAGGGASAAASTSSDGQVDFHPAFVWLLRDFQLELREGRTRLTPAEYLEEALADAPQSTGGADAAARNAPRQTIRAVFPDRDAFTLVRPALTEEQLNKLDTLPPSSLRPEFRQGMDDLARRLKDKAVRRPLAVHGSLVSGPALAGLVRAYVDAINGGAVPQLVSAWAGVARQECGKAVELGKAAYDEAWREPSLDGSAAADDAALQAAHALALQAALRAFRDASMGDADLRLEHEEALRASLDARLEEKRRAAAASSERVARELLEAETQRLGQMLSLGPAADLDAVETELRRFLDAYDRAVPATWPPKYKRAAEFLMNCILGLKGLLRAASAARDDAAQRAAAAEASAADLRAQGGAAQERAAAAERAAQDLRQRLAAVEADLQQRAEALAVAEAELGSARAAGGREAAALRDEVGTLRQEAARASAGLQEAAQARARLEAEAAQLRADAQAVRARESDAQRQLSALQREAAGRAEKEKALELRCSAAERELAQARARVSELELAAQGELQGERGRVAEATAELARAQRDLAAERAAADKARTALAEAKAEAAALRAAAGAGGGGGGGAAAATPASGRAHPASAGKRARRGSGAAGAGAGAGAAAAEDDDFMDAEEAEPAPAPSPPSRRGAAAAAAPSPAAASVEPLPDDPAKMTVAALKQWVTDNRIEDAEFMQLCGGKAKKADWVAYVKKRSAELGR